MRTRNTMKAKSNPSRSSEKDKSVSVHTVARVARVSSGTVSRVMNRRGDVDPALRQRVLNISRQLGFVPKVQRQTIAVIIGRVDPFGPVGYVAAMLAALVHEFAKYDYLV